MKYNSLVIAFIFCTCISYSQQSNYFNRALGDDLGNNFIRPSAGQGAMGGEWFKKNDLDANLYKTRFMQYHSKNFSKAKLNFENIAGFFRYNMYRDEMEFMRSDKIYYLVKKIGTEVKFTNSNTYGVYKNNKKLRYYKIIVDGKAGLLIKESVRLIKGRYARTSYQKDKLSKFEREKDAYFISFDNIEAIQIPKRKKDFYNLFTTKSKEVKSYVKKNKLDYKDIKELKKIIKYYNAL